MFTGLQYIHIRDEALGISFPAAVMYPTAIPPIPTFFGVHTIEASTNAPIQKGEYPLVVVSHGNGGSHLIYPSICTYLAACGYVVIMLEHHANNYLNNHQEWTYENLVNRPRHVRLTIDTVSTHPFFGEYIQKDAVGVIGHSMGGYTALAVAGGTPQSQDGRKVDVVPDQRVKALVLLAPATPWYLPAGSLRQVKAPILMLTAEHDAYTPDWHAELVLNGVPDRSQVTSRVVKNAGHFSFISPFPLKLRSPAFLPSTDPAGFDRDSFHQILPLEIGEFLNQTLKITH